MTATRFLVGLLIAAAVAFALVSARYTIEAAGGPGAIWQLDRWTGAVRFCAAQENRCREWTAP